MTEWPKVSVIVLNYNGRQHLEKCFDSLAKLDYPAHKLELMLVDNASADDSVSYLRQHFPQVVVVENERNLGFAAGNNRGAKAASGEYIAFLNNDTRVDPQWVKELVKPCVADASIACTASKILSWDGRVVDFVDSAMNFHGFAFQLNHGMSDVFHESRSLIFACGGAMLIRREIFLQIGGFDEDYFIYFEDMDLGWRLALAGYDVISAPNAIVYHRLHATMDAFTEFRKWVLFERNALVTVIKNYDDENLQKILAVVLMLAFKRSKRLMEAAGWNPAQYQIQNRSDVGMMDTVSRSGLAVLVAVNEVIEQLPSILKKRSQVQALRKRTDEEVLPLFRQSLRTHTIANPKLDEQYAHIQYQLLDLWGIDTLFHSKKRRVLIVSSDLLPVNGLPTTGAGLRAWSIGQGLESQGHEVFYSMPRAAAVGREKQILPPLSDLLWEQGRLDDVVDRASPEIVVACGWSTLANLNHCQVPVVLDQHGPHLLERKFQKHLDESVNAAEKLIGLRKADFFTCAGERQRKYFIPWLEKAGFENPLEESAVVPVSLGGTWPAVNLQKYDDLQDPVFVYGGVFLPWQDPSLALLTLVERMEFHGRGKLRIFGGKHPYLPIDTTKFQTLVDRLSASQRVEISPMLGRDELLAEYANAHVALDLMRRNEERELAFTTRTVEYLWCGLPVIYNDYAELADYIGPADAGWTLNPEDKDKMSAIFDEILLNPSILKERAQNARTMAETKLNWKTTIDPIAQFCQNPYKRFVDTTQVEVSQSATVPPNTPPVIHTTTLPQKSLRTLIGEAVFHFRRGGLRMMVYETLGFLQRKLQP